MQDHPVPAIAVAVSPEGNVSVTVTVPDVAPLPLLFTVIVYVAPACPCVKFPVCDFVMLRSASCVTVVASLAVSFEVLVSPPPDTAAVFVIEAAAELLTFTVRVIAG